VFVDDKSSDVIKQLSASQMSTALVRFHPNKKNQKRKEKKLNTHY